jgi:hypothetical protein
MIEGSGPDPYLWLVDPDPGSPKTCGSGGSGSGTLISIDSDQYQLNPDSIPGFFMSKGFLGFGRSLQFSKENV